MNTYELNTTRQQAAAGMLAIAMTLGMLLGVNHLAAPNSTDAMMAAAPAASAAVAHKS